MDFFANRAVTDNVVMWGQVAIGLALIVGAATRRTVVAGASMMGLFCVAQLPPEQGWVGHKIIYNLALNVLWVVRAGTYFGIAASSSILRTSTGLSARCLANRPSDPGTGA